MPEIPPQAVQAATRALWERDFSGYDECSHSVSEMPRLALIALEVGGPAIAEQARAEERARIAEEIRRLGDWPDGYSAFRAFVDLHRLYSGDRPVFSALLLALADMVGRVGDA